MRMILFFFLMAVFIVLLSNLGSYFSRRSDGIPDVMAKLFPERFVNQEEKLAVETGMAPFAAAENAAQPVELHPDIKYDPLGDSINVTESLDVPHRHEAAVSAWVTESVSEALNFTLDGFEDHKAKLPILMDQNAIREFLAFLDKSQMLGLMQTKNYELKTFVMDVPQMRTNGVVDNRFRWIYDIPVNLTFLPTGSTSYQDLDESKYEFETLNFRVQIGRVATPKECKDQPLHKQRGVCHGLVIETWEALKKAAPKEEPAQKKQ